MVRSIRSPSVPAIETDALLHHEEKPRRRSFLNSPVVLHLAANCYFATHTCAVQSCHTELCDKAGASLTAIFGQQFHGRFPDW
ncbi:MAG: hypothetical protein KDA81_06175, partial [Planctomycetaceae bacterium]|nr:hypothetical protein [Planctomycetaceae bacterium]